jgi:hypothetical protein
VLEAYWLAVHEVVWYVRVRHRGWDERPDGYVSWPLVVDILRALGWAVRSSWRKLREGYAAWLATVPTVLGYELPTYRLGGLRVVDEAAWERQKEISAAEGNPATELHRGRGSPNSRR